MSDINLISADRKMYITDSKLWSIDVHGENSFNWPRLVESIFYTIAMEFQKNNHRKVSLYLPCFQHLHRGKKIISRS